MADEVQRQHDVTRALETATRFRESADTMWRAAIAEALAEGVPREVILKVAGGWDVTELRDILRDLDQRGCRRELESGAALPPPRSMQGRQS